ncbi:putative bifunctional diguanylate cyclase/phosphodiesterase [Legionella oakridgensis]|uniref:cyclic-guanylate-specific phosphodiesterase n=2 Tax=Legionella oakridgensis TaxID=29423 RepID=W0BC62_9GAMM|nr:EAL domain-containing protein [Legionella oakridgensis]AHE67440.1 EAL domain protein [Legionella oakridgensis ATCC 33761 = DSM 21215]ETO92971.1 EAL domain protein [Legionella oakridgensis RV-2-2007]KTD43499.1 regulatory protein (GGDEF and EAL domains) [Legionella oakridgensis]STY20491.1 regulatory protein (GGDEF and EAL domains) [Legionella longbeachae]
MGKQGINFEKVAAIAARIKKQGKEPSLMDVCEEMGLLSIISEVAFLLEKWHHLQPEFKQSHAKLLLENMPIDVLWSAENPEFEKSMVLLYAFLESTVNNILITEAANQVQIDKALKHALANEEFYLVYQPLINIKKLSTAGFEALLRWNSPMLGAISPFEFIPVAEKNGLIIEIGTWVLEEACTQMMHWHEQGFSELTIAVNISGRQLYQTNFPQLIDDVLRKTGLLPKYLELELTESLFITNIAHAVKIMHQFKEIGLKLAIDDFGTGYSSLSYLKQFPVDKLKIDKSFIHDLVNNVYDAAIVKAVINLGHSLNLQVLAEGVESEDQKNFIITHGCDFAQGFYFNPPAKPETLSNYLNQYLS